MSFRWDTKLYPTGEHSDLVGEMLLGNEVEGDESCSTKKCDQGRIHTLFNEVVGMQPQSHKNSKAYACEDDTPFQSVKRVADRSG